MVAFKEGSIRIRKGMVFIKTGMPARWETLKRVNYELVYGPVPLGTVIKHKDGNPKNCDPKNLYAEIKHIPMEIFQTKDYDSFKVIVSNREVDKTHVKKLSGSIRRKNLLYIRPVIVNTRMEVIDGQHRIAACQEIDETVYYIKVDQLSKEDIAILNTAQKNWTRMDFINFYAIEGRDEYRKLSKLINKYPVKVSFLLSFCLDAGRRIREGVLQVTEETRCVQVCEWIMELHTRGFEFVFARDFGRALNSVVKTEAQFKDLIRQATEDTLVKCSSYPEYRNMLKAIN
jgi:hypothetical protein